MATLNAFGPVWSSVAYCMVCDKRVSVNATVCPHCGQTFGPDKKESN